MKRKETVWTGERCVFTRVETLALLATTTPPSLSGNKTLLPTDDFCYRCLEEQSLHKWGDKTNIFCDGWKLYFHATLKEDVPLLQTQITD